MATFQEYETEQATARPFSFSRTSTENQLENQLDISQVSPFSGYSSYQTPTVEQEEETTPSYEVEREYNIDKLPEDEVIIPTFMPLLKTEAQEKSEENVKIKLNARGKIIVSAFAVIVGILIAFMVYNAVIISNLTKNVNSLTEKQSLQTKSITALQSDYSEISNYEYLEMEAGDLGFSYSNETNDIAVNLPPRPEISEAPKSTNWFNNLCEFLSELFN